MERSGHWVNTREGWAAAAGADHAPQRISQNADDDNAAAPRFSAVPRRRCTERPYGTGVSVRPFFLPAGGRSRPSAAAAKVPLSPRQGRAGGGAMKTL